LNLHGVVIGAISAVNPQSWVTVKVNDGYTVAADGTQVPKYIKESGFVEIQSLSAKEIEHLASTNLQAVTKKLYAYGAINGIVRRAALGGDIIEAGSITYLVVHVFEDWDSDGGWCAVGLKEQLEAACS
jgi:hypothetical protein